jgi:hypothetical protein
MADPFNDRISNSTVVWQSEPATRGTFDILSTCLITLTLCVWSSIHLNLPRNERGRQQTFWHRFRWLIYGLLAPEFLVLMAWTQRQAARAIHEEVPATYKLNERTKVCK